MAARKSSNSENQESNKKPVMNFVQYLEQFGDDIPKYHRESLKILFKGYVHTRDEWRSKIRKEMSRPIG